MMLKTRVSPVAVLGAFVLLLAVIVGCDSQELQDQFAREASGPPSGITETTIDGEILSRDDDDWRTSPAYRGVLNVTPAFPNPAAEDQIHIPVSVTEFERVAGGFMLRAYRGTTFVTLGTAITQTDPGIHVLRFSPGELATKGLHRVYIFDLASELVSYGDIMIQ